MHLNSRNLWLKLFSSRFLRKVFIVILRDNQNKARFCILGTSASVPTKDRDNTSILFFSNDESILVDCGNAPFRKLEIMGISPRTLKHVIVTHAHVDHMYGLPSLIQSLWHSGYEQILTIHCLPETKSAIDTLLNSFDLLQKVGMFPVEFSVLPDTELTNFMNTNDFSLYSSPVQHTIPNIGLRVEEKISGARKTVVYSSDTEPCDSLLRLASNADTLILECTFTSETTSHHGLMTSLDAGTVASQASVDKLLLVHLDPAIHGKKEQMIEEVRTNYRKGLVIPDDMDIFLF
jgi:ribonuclease Z